MTVPHRFSGAGGVSAARWLRSLTYDLPAPLTPGQWLERVDSLLNDDAARWADQHPRVRRIMTDEYFDDATEEDVEIFKKALMAAFPPEPWPPLYVCEAEEHLSSLAQGPFEDLEDYYRRTETILYALGSVDVVEAPLTVTEAMTLMRVIEQFVLGLRNRSVRDAVIPFPRISGVQGLGEMYRYARYLSHKANSTEQIPGARPPTLMPFTTPINSISHEPEPCLAFSAVFGHGGISHDSFTRAKYGIHQEGAGMLTAGPGGLTSTAPINDVFHFRGTTTPSSTSSQTNASASGGGTFAALSNVSSTSSNALNQSEVNMSRIQDLQSPSNSTISLSPSTPATSKSSDTATEIGKNEATVTTRGSFLSSPTTIGEVKSPSPNPSSNVESILGGTLSSGDLTPPPSSLPNQPLAFGSTTKDSKQHEDRPKEDGVTFIFPPPAEISTWKKF